jgi:hypothetical protein
VEHKHLLNLGFHTIPKYIYINLIMADRIFATSFKTINIHNLTNRPTVVASIMLILSTDNAQRYVPVKIKNA